jgi:RHS repeat-associated protein
LISGSNFGSIDALQYGYLNGGNSNQLMYVNNHAVDEGPDSFLDNGSISTTTPEFSYDQNGNMTFDGNKSMDFSYNFLNLPATAFRYHNNQAQVIYYHYTASGRKIREQNILNGSAAHRYYAGPFVFITNTSDPAWINTPYGRFVQHNGQWTTEIHLKDHLGNTCLAMLRTSPTNHNISQENHYYPFGMRITSLSPEPVSMGDRKNRYMYNGKEFNDEFGLNWYDYGARFYDPQIARWHSVDPLAEKAYSWTPYRYGFNNPISYIDPDGMFETRREAREHRREEGIRGRVRKQNDGTYAVHHRGTNGGIRTFNDSEFGATTSVVFEYSGSNYTQKGGNPIPGSGTYETNATAEHTGPAIDPTGLGGRGGTFGRRGTLGMVLSNLVSKIFGIAQESNGPAGVSSNSTGDGSNSELIPSQSQNETNTMGDSVDIRVTKWKQENFWGGSARIGKK